MADIAITAANVAASATTNIRIVTLAPGVTATQGQYLYAVTGTQTQPITVGLAAANGTLAQATVCGVTVSAGSPGQQIAYNIVDATFAFGGSVTSGLPIFLSSAASGHCTQTPGDLSAGNYVVILGQAVSGNVINLFNPASNAPVVHG